MWLQRKDDCPVDQLFCPPAPHPHQCSPSQCRSCHSSSCLSISGMWENWPWILTSVMHLKALNFNYICICRPCCLWTLPDWLQRCVGRLLQVFASLPKHYICQWEWREATLLYIAMARYFRYKVAAILFILVIILSIITNHHQCWRSGIWYIWDQYICSAGGVAAGTATAGAGVPAAILACNVAQVGKCQQAWKSGQRCAIENIW